MAQPKARPAVEGFPASPYPFAETIRLEREERRKAREIREEKARAATAPHHSVHGTHRRMILGIKPQTTKKFAAKGLGLYWITKQQWEEYQEIGYQQVTYAEIEDGLSPARPDDSAVSRAGSVVTRRNMMLVKGPAKWQEDRILIEQHQAAAQAGKDPFEEEFGQQRGRFGKNSKRRPTSAVDAEDEDDDL